MNDAGWRTLPGMSSLAEHRAPSGASEVWSQAWPTVLTMTSYTLMGFVDALMVARVGPLEVAAQGNGGMWSFLPISFVFGVLTVVNTFTAQNVGAGRGRQTAVYGWAGLWTSLLAWACILVPWAIAVPSLFQMVGHEPELVAKESAYARVLLLGGLPLLVAKAMSHWFFGYQRPRLITVSAIAGNVVNVVANAILIFGEDVAKKGTAKPAKPVKLEATAAEENAAVALQSAVRGHTVRNEQQEKSWSQK